MGKFVRAVYGEALFEYAKEENCLKEWQEITQRLQKVFRENSQLEAVMGHPGIKKQEKCQLLENALEGRIPTALLGFLLFVVKKNRFKEIDSILEEFLKRGKRFLGIGTVTIVSAMELTREQKKQICDRLVETTGYSSVEAGYQVNPGLLGGIQIRIGDRLLDGSVKGKLERITSQWK